MNDFVSADLLGGACNNCGACCVLPGGIDCKHLKRLPCGKTYCLIYADRLGAFCGVGADGLVYHCTFRAFINKNIKNCPQNKE